MIFRSWEETGITGINTGRAGVQKTTCPSCSKDRKKQGMKCLSVNALENWFKCNHCGFSGKVYEKVELPVRTKKEYVRPERVNITDLSQELVDWFFKRGISQETLKRNNIGEGETKIFAKDKDGWVNRRTMQFNYFREGQIINIKYRDAAKNFKMHQGAELILYGLDDVRGKETITITEGEVDKLSWDEAGIRECVSVPNGATLQNNNLTYLDNCWQDLESATKIILAVDGDKAGDVLRSDLAARLGKERCWTIAYPEGCKDANEVLVKYGAEALSKVYQSAKPWPMEGIYTGEEVSIEVGDFYVNGLPKGDSIQHAELNKLLTWRRGEMTCVTGIPGSGKSDMVDEIAVALAVQHGWKFGVYSPENYPVGLHVVKLMEKYAAMAFFSQTEKMDPETMLKALDFILEHFHFIRMDVADVTVDGILQKAKDLKLRYGIDGFIADPWNRIEHNIPPGISETNYVSKSLDKINRFKVDYNVHWFQVAHPVKMRKAKDDPMRYEVPTLYDISGSSNFFNKTDNGMCVYRDFLTNKTSVFVQKVKWKFMGKVGSVDFDYDIPTGRYKETAAIGWHKHYRPEPPERSNNNRLPYRDDVEDVPF